MLIILDGWGLREEREANAVKLGHVPTFNRLWVGGMYATTTLGASGECVGLPKGQIGGSEVGHLNLGAGTMIYTDLTYIDKQIESGQFFKNPVLSEAMDRAVKNGGTLHLLGLVSDGGIHSYNTHIYAMIDMAKQRGVKKLALHALTDGRDTRPDSGKGYVADLQKHLQNAGVGKIATVIGRYYAMDRDKRWDRTALAYNALVNGQAERSAADPVAAVQSGYDEGTTDEFLRPYIIKDSSGAPIARIQSGDTIIGFNFRGDRMRQIYKALMQPDFDGFPREPLKDLHFVSMASWGDEIHAPKAFHRPPQATCLAEVLSKADEADAHGRDGEIPARHVLLQRPARRSLPWRGAHPGAFAQGRAHLRQEAADERHPAHRGSAQGHRQQAIRLHPAQLRQPGYGRPHRRAGGGHQGRGDCG
jgi:2,3-bisphosphoglycerate-independent phosphoglycerate mutase